MIDLGVTNEIESVKAVEINYHDRPELSYSKLKLFKENKLLYYMQYIEKSIAKETTEAMKFGTAFDDYLTNPNNFDAKWTISTGSKTTTKIDHITTVQLEQIKKMTASLLEYNNFTNDTLDGFNFSQLLDMAQLQKEIYWLHDERFACRGKMDLYLELLDTTIIIDIKTTKEISLADCIKAIYYNNYHLQAGMYCNGVLANTGIYPDFYFAFISKSTYETFLIKMSREYIEYGRYEANVLIVDLDKTTRENSWLEQTSVTMAEIPSWINNNNYYGV